VFTVFRDWGLLQANGSARVRLGGTEVIASVKVRVLAIFSALYKFSML
jgi:exosome complex RNA-binding protein Rrp42 (RNase PH superfamily)